MRLIDADALIDKCGDWYVEEGTDEGFIGTLKSLLDEQPEQRWIPVTDIPPRGRDLILKIHDTRNSFFYYHMGFHDGEEYFTYNFCWQRDKDLEIVGWQLCPWEEGEQK